jgi:hypothetical protein
MPLTYPPPSLGCFLTQLHHYKYTNATTSSPDLDLNIKNQNYYPQIIFRPETTKHENSKEVFESSTPSSPPSTDETTKKQNLNSSSIDMEEIFKNVLEGASRVLRGEDPFDSGKPPSKKKKKASQSTTPPKTENESQSAPKNKPTAKKNKLKPKPIVEEIQMSEPVTMAYSEENMENNLEEGFPCELNFVNGEDFHQVNNYNKLPSCSQLLNPSRVRIIYIKNIFVHPI